MKKTFFYISIIILFFSCNIQKNTQNKERQINIEKLNEYVSLCEIKDLLSSQIDEDLPTILVIDGVPIYDTDTCSNIIFESFAIKSINCLKRETASILGTNRNVILIVTKNATIHNIPK